MKHGRWVCDRVGPRRYPIDFEPRLRKELPSPYSSSSDQFLSVSTQACSSPDRMSHKEISPKRCAARPK